MGEGVSCSPYGIPVLRRYIFCVSPHYFKDVKISSLALLKMVMHARSGGKLEVMGLMLGKTDGPSMVVMDTFALPVEGTETRVNAQAAAYEYMSTYIETAKKVGLDSYSCTCVLMVTYSCFSKE